MGRNMFEFVRITSYMNSYSSCGYAQVGCSETVGTYLCM